MVELVLDERRRTFHRDSGLDSSSLLSSSHIVNMGGPGMDWEVLWDATDSEGLVRAVGAVMDCWEEAREMDTSGCVFIGDQPSKESGLGVVGAVVDTASAGGISELYLCDWVETGVRFDIISWL